MAAAMGRPGRFRHRFRVRHESGEDTVRLDFDREPSENVREILRYVVLQQGVGKGKKLAYLNSFVKLIRKMGDNKVFGVENIEILACLQIGLMHEAKEVRAAVLRVLRHLLLTEDMLRAFLALHMDYLVMRCLDVCLDNEIERIHAIRLIRQISSVAPKMMPHSLVYSIIAVGNDGAIERDRFVRICLATLCEITLCNVDLVGTCGGISTLLWNILDSHQYPRLNESLTCTLMYLLNHPRSRHYIKANTDLETLLAPLTDSQFHLGGETSAEEKHQQAARREELEFKAREERETRFVASKLSLITLMHTWPGLIRLCHPRGSGIQSLIGILYLPYIEIRKHILEMISDAFRLTLPDWTEDFASALVSVDPLESKDLWKLTEGFVAEEGRVLLPHCSSTRPNLVDNHIALLLSAWINAGLLEALVEVVTSSEGPLFNRSILLLGEILHMSSVLLPAECYSHSHCLPVLLTMASSATISTPQRHRACMAVKHLSEFHGLKKRGLVPSSLFLDQLLQHAGKFSETTSRHWYLRRDKLCDYYYKKIPNDDNTQHAVRDSQVNSTKENFNWDWDLIGSILKWPDDRLRKMEDQIYIRFLRRVVFFFKPTNHLFSHMEISAELGPSVCQVACQLVDFLVSLSQEEVQKLTTELLTDINHCLSEVTMNHAVPECVFGSQSLHNTLCMYYFLMIGRFSTIKTGCALLEKTGIFQSLMEIMTPSTQDMHVRLAISALNYGMDGSARVVLSKALTATSESCRLYSTRFLRVLLRAGTHGFSTWGMELLVTQLYDQSQAVTSTALTILDEACDIEANLLQLIKLRPSVLHLGDGGVLLLCRYLSVPAGFRSLRDANYIPSEMERWQKTYCVRYVAIVEELLNEALTSHEKGTYGGLTRRSIHKTPNKDVFLPVHLYGQLALHEEGMDLLKKEPCLQEYFAIIHSQELVEDADILKLKEALWAVGHVGSSAYGVSLLEEESIVPELIRLAEECGVFSIRGTAFYVLGLVASTRRGAEVLAKYGWESKCHTRRELWPVLDEQGWIAESVPEPVTVGDQSCSKRSQRAEAGRLPSVGSSQLSFIKEETVRSEQSGAAGGGLFYGDGGVGGRLDLTIGENRVSSSTSVHSDSSDILAGVPRSRTLPSESADFRRYQTLPARSLSERHIHRRGLPLAQLSRPVEERCSSTDAEVMVPAAVTTDAIMIRVEGVEGAGEDFHPGETCEVAPFPVIRLRADSEDEPASPELGDSKGKEPMFRIGSASGSSSSGGQKEDRSSSDSSQRSKGRADSFNTDSTTSGVSSCESGTMPAVTSAVSSLSPIPSSSSINTISTSIPSIHSHTAPASAEAKHTHDAVHPSTAHRKLWNLNRIPSTRRRSQSPALGSMQSLPGSRSSSSFFTSHRDVWGYATLRNIRRKRTYSADADPDSTNSHDSGVESRISRTVSVDSDTSVDSNIWLSIRRNVSSASLADHEQQSQQMSASTLTSFKPLSLHNRFVGLTLPVDVNMMFEVVEGEDSRSSVFKQKSPEETLTEKLSECKVSVPQHVPPLRKEGTSEHNRDICLLCSWSRQHCFRAGDMPKGHEDVPHIDAEGDTVGRKDSDGDSVVPGERDVRSRGSSMNEQVSSATPGSQTSSTSSDSASKKLTEDSMEGRRLIRMEIMRLIINLSSSVGLKGSEQGLLSLKQRFPSTFKDVCFFSEICSLMSSLSFRLNARRFIQELFDEIDITKLVEGTYGFLGIKEEDLTHMAPIWQDSMDSFADFS